MTETVGVCIATFGDWEKWGAIGKRAVASIQKQTRPPDRWEWPHGITLAETRNFGAKCLNTDWIIFLDADDELDPNYIEAMLAGSGDIRRPSTLGIYEDGSEEESPSMIPRKDIRIANYIVIGAMCRREQFMSVGGFKEYPMLEDFDLWRRMVANGAEVVEVPEAVYRIGVHPNSRNTDLGLHSRVYRDIING